MNEKYRAIAAESIPDGYVRVRSGRIAGDDLVYSWTTNEWLRADDQAWLDNCEFVGQAVCVARNATVDNGQLIVDSRDPRQEEGPLEMERAATVGEQGKLFSVVSS